MTKRIDRFMFLGLALLSGPLLTACGDSAPAPRSSVRSESALMMPAPMDVHADWIGKKWTGRDGAFLLLSRDKDAYAVLIKSMAGDATYKGVSTGGQIRFKRDGILESIRSTGGRETGIEAFFGKDDCLTIKDGEGFCRDAQSDLKG